MNLLAWQMKWRLISLVAASLLWRMRGALLLPFLLLRHALTPVPKRLLITPQDIRTADPTIADDIYAGHFALGGYLVNAHGASPFEMEPPHPAWSRTLLGFGWLRHLRAANTALARANARALVNDFIVHARHDLPEADEPRVLARRIISWLSQLTLILDNADHAFYRRFLRSLAAAQGRLQRFYSTELTDDARLLAAIALANYALCAKVGSGIQRRAIRQLSRELTRQLLTDGGHVSRNPRLLVELLLDLLPLRQAFAARSILAPPQLLNSIDRMMPMLRLFRHGDGMLALFNGMGATAPDLVAAVLANEDAQAQPMTNARPSGYQRLEAGPSLLIADMGAPPPAPFSLEAHAGCLAFEFSCGEQRIIVNCGAPPAQRLEARALVRSTAAHSTLTIADTSSAHVAGAQGTEGWLEGQIIAGPTRVPVTRGQDAGGLFVEAGHDGYVAAFDLVHSRRLALAPDGGQLAGQDRLLRAGKQGEPQPRSFALRFHLHPAVVAQLGANATSVRLTLANGDGWRFEAGALTLTLEEGIFFGGATGARVSQQIVLHGVVEAEAQITWWLTKDASAL